jgi:hypothetical protein
MPEETPRQGIPSAADLISAQEARREQRARRKNLRLVERPAEVAPDGVADTMVRTANAAPPGDIALTQRLINAEMKRMSRETRQHPEFSVRAERQARNAARDANADTADADTAAREAVAGPEQLAPPSGDEAEPETGTVAGEPEKAGRANRRRANTADKARRKNTSASSEESLLLVRQLSLTTQQLNAAHRVIGRLSAERDILRKHFADAVGIPVHEVVVATDTDAAEAALKEVHVEAKAPSRLEKLNYFNSNDYAQMRRRRQTFVAILLAFVLVLWGLSRAGYWRMPDNISRDSLGAVPIIGDLMTYFLAGWLFFRVGKVSSKGIRWVFPQDKRPRRQR